MNQIIKQLRENNRHYSVERAILIGISLLALWLIALMTFMENGQNHITNLAFISALTILLVGLAKALPQTKYQGYLVGIAAIMISIIAYFRLNSFFIHSEIIFSLAVIGVAARWGVKQGLFCAFLAMISNGFLNFFYEYNGLNFEIPSIWRVLFCSRLHRWCAYPPKGSSSKSSC